MNDVKLIKTSKNIDKLLKVLQGCMVVCSIVCSIVCIAFIPLTLIFGKKMLRITNTISFSDISLHIADTSYLNLSGYKIVLIAILILSAVMIIGGWYYLKVIRSIFTPMKEGRPFERGVSNQIRKLAWITLIGGAFLELGKTIISVLEFNMYDLSNVFNHDVVTGYTHNHEVNGVFIITTILLFLLSHVFRYGEELQKESDETL